MTEYTDVPQVSELYLEQQHVRAAIQLIDAGGTLTYLTISPPPPPEGEAATVMPIGLQVTGPVQQSTMDAIRAQLVTRDAAITAELTALGVINAPPAER